MTKVLPILTLLAVTTVAGAQGTIQLANTAGTRFLIHGFFIIGPAPRPDPTRFFFGVFVGPTADSLSSQPVLPLATNSSTQGIISGPRAGNYPLPGFEPGSTAFIQVRGWEIRFGTDWQRSRDEGLFGQTAIRPFVLGPANGVPGTVIWSAQDPDRFQRINLVPEPSILGFAGLGLASVWLFRLSARNPSR